MKALHRSYLEFFVSEHANFARQLFTAMLGVLVAANPTLLGQNSDVDIPLPLLNQAHSHNDYEHKRPLYDALELGFCSIEADVFLIDNQLLVAHERHQTSKERTLEALYLQPLQERFQKYSGSIYSLPTQVTLLIDIKSQGAETYRALHELLQKYAPMLSSTHNGIHRPKAVTVIVSGNRPWKEIEESNPRYVGIDGRLSDLESDHPSHLLPLISDNWRNHFQWRGDGTMSPQEKNKLKSLVEKCHSQGRRIRFWATPESERLWSELKTAEVDLIGTDELKRLKEFLTP